MTKAFPAGENLRTAISAATWQAKYRRTGSDGVADRGIEDTWRRVAGALAAAESADREAWAQRFYAALEDFRFLPGGRILAGAGTGERVTLFNCFVMGTVEDSIDGIFDALKEGALTMQQGGGVGYDFSTLRPAGSSAHSTGTIASGPVSFMRIWDAMCATILSTGARRGAMMATLRCDHPDIEAFIAAKHDARELRHFNLSVLVTDAFMQAVRSDAGWPLVFPAPAETAAAPTIFRSVKARALWQNLMRANYDYAEPGVIFIDRVRRLDNLGYCERISATNPCGEIPLPQQRTVAHASRRIGLGITGLADALVMLGIEYGTPRSLDLAAGIMRTLCHAAYRASTALARDKGAFKLFKLNQYVESEFVAALPDDIRGAIRRDGIRNSHLTAIAPAGTISLLAGNVSSGLEPIYAADGLRSMRLGDDKVESFEVTDYACARYRELTGTTALPPAFAAAAEVDPRAHLAMQAALQPYVDNAISKTINVPEELGFEAFCSLYEEAYALGLKGCTTFRPNPVTGSVLTSRAVVEGPAHCCGIEREAD